MKIVLLMWIFIFPLVLKAQVSINQQKLLYQNKVISFTKMKHAGIAMTFGGAIVTVAGIAVMSNSGYDPNYPTSEAYDKFLSGYLITILGVAATGGGITFWAIGDSKTKKYKQKLNSVSLNINPVPGKLVSIAYRF
jgi:hypothetical protein